MYILYVHTHLYLSTLHVIWTGESLSVWEQLALKDVGTSKSLAVMMCYWSRQSCKEICFETDGTVRVCGHALKSSCVEIFLSEVLQYVLFLFMLQRCWICRSDLIHTASSDESFGSSHVLVSVAAVISDPTFSFWWFSWHCSVSGCHGVQYESPFDHGIIIKMDFTL